MANIPLEQEQVEDQGFSDSLFQWPPDLLEDEAVETKFAGSETLNAFDNQLMNDFGGDPFCSIIGSVSAKCESKRQRLSQVDTSVIDEISVSALEHPESRNKRSKLSRVTILKFVRSNRLQEVRNLMESSELWNSLFEQICDQLIASDNDSCLLNVFDSDLIFLQKCILAAIYFGMTVKSGKRNQGKQYFADWICHENQQKNFKDHKDYFDVVYNMMREEPSDVGYAGKIIACFSKIEPESLFRLVKTYVSPGNDDAAFVFRDIKQTAARCR